MTNHYKPKSSASTLRLLRVKNDLSQKELSEILKVDQATISRLESGKTFNRSLYYKAIKKLSHTPSTDENTDLSAITTELSGSPELRRLVELVIQLHNESHS